MLGFVTSESPGLPWRPGSATGAGSMPGTDPLQAARTVFDELPDLPHLAELPGRGAGADIIGRAIARRVEMPAETTPAGWRLAGRPGRDAHRARALLSQDLDVLEEVAAGYQGPLKVQVCGPWTLAASLELPGSLEAALGDRGAVADLIESLAEGVAAHVADVRRRVPGASVLLQLDEPTLPAALAGGLSSVSGLRQLAPVEPSPAADALRAVQHAAGADALVHVCAAPAPFGIIAESGARAVWIDLSLLRREDYDPLAELAGSGSGIVAGVLQPTDSERCAPQDLARRVIELWRRLGLEPARCASQVVIAPACGLAGVSPERAAAVLADCREAGRILPELIEEGTG
jgi:methionine synthase II (cobalamin-independent)